VASAVLVRRASLKISSGNALLGTDSSAEGIGELVRRLDCSRMSGLLLRRVAAHLSHFIDGANMIDAAHILGFRGPDASRSTPAQVHIRHHTTGVHTVWQREDLWHAGPKSR
jgi:hypothetical protein